MRGWQVKLCDPLTTCAISEYFCDEIHLINRCYSKVSLPLPFTCYSALGKLWSSGESLRLGIKRSRVRSLGGAKKWVHVCKYLPLLSCVLCYLMCLIVLLVCTIVNLWHWVSLAPLFGSVYNITYAKLHMLCYVHMMIYVILYALSCMADIV